jgi:ankyrin repeat protein
MIRYSLALVVCAGVALGQEKPKPIDVATLKEATKKPLQLIKKSQEVFIEKGMCNSCHHQILPILAHVHASRRGIEFDAAHARTMAERCLSEGKDLDYLIQRFMYIDDTDDAWNLFVAKIAGVPQSTSTAARAQFLASAQRADGSWYTMDSRPPQAYGRITTTTISAFGVKYYLPDQFQAERQAVLDRARTWLLKAAPRTTEERAFHLLGLLWTGAAESDRHKAAQEILAEQHEDGGWGQSPKLGSDSYSTGETLYALRQGVGLAIDDPAYQRGLHYLLKTQEADGSWKMESRLQPTVPVSPEYFSSGFPHGRRHQYIAIMGTTWATIALLEAVPPQSSDRPEPPLPDLQPTERDEWIRIALNGSAADLKKALAGGMNANAKTAGGTTALMLAARDPAKVKVLIDAGADVNARGKFGFNALMVAARYRGNVESVRLLLKHGAKATPEKDVKVENNLAIMYLAATSGDTEIAKALLDAGAPIDALTMVVTTIPTTPIMAATLRGDTAMVEYLIGRGAEVNPSPDASPIGTPLGRAVVNNHSHLVKLLLAKGAKVNQVDGLGMTALHYAATVDFADPTNTQLLLAAGADPKAKDKQGHTAWELAKEYKHGVVEEVLNSKTPGR